MAETEEVLNTTPEEIVAGTTVTWNLSPEHKPVEGYALKFNLAGVSNYVTKTGATVDDDTFSLTLLPADTSSLPTGVYHYQIFTEKGSGGSLERYLEADGQLRVHALIGAAGDNRSFAKKIVDAIDALVLGRASTDQMSYQIGNRALSRIPLPDLVQVRKQYAAIVEAEYRAQRIKQGKAAFPSIKFKFGSR